MDFNPTHCAALGGGHSIATAKGCRTHQHPSTFEHAGGHFALQHIDSRHGRKTFTGHLVRHTQLARGI